MPNHIRHRNTNRSYSNLFKQWMMNTYTCLHFCCCLLYGLLLFNVVLYVNLSATFVCIYIYLQFCYVYLSACGSPDVCLFVFFISYFTVKVSSLNCWSLSASARMYLGSIFNTFAGDGEIRRLANSSIAILHNSPLL